MQAIRVGWAHWAEYSANQLSVSQFSAAAISHFHNTWNALCWNPRFLQLQPSCLIFSYETHWGPKKEKDIILGRQEYLLDFITLCFNDSSGCMLIFCNCTSKEEKKIFEKQRYVGKDGVCRSESLSINHSRTGRWRQNWYKYSILWFTILRRGKGMTCKKI